MTIQLIEGFDQVPGATDVRATLEDFGYQVFGSGALSWSEGREPGSQALTLAQRSNNVSVAYTAPVIDQVAVIGFALTTTERAQVLSVNDGALVLGWSDEGLLLRDQVSTAKPIRNRWYYLELVIDQLEMECHLYINGELDVSTALPSELSGAETLTFALSGVNPTNEAGQPPPEPGVDLPVDMTFDDLYIAGERFGPIAVRTRFPDADAETEWETASGGGDHWREVTQQPPSDARYITTAVTGARDMFTSSASLPDDADVIAVALTARARKGDIDARALGLVLGDGEDQQELVEEELTLESRYYTRYFRPGAGGAWNPVELAAMPFGVVAR